MGDISIIARRLEGGTRVQYGWSGNGGYYQIVGDRLLCWYNDAEKVEYLFGLGQMALIGKPGSEHGGEALVYTNRICGQPHYLGKSETEIFSRIMFIDYGYFYDLDEVWYYVIPGPFRIKIPLGYIRNHLDERDYEFEERDRIVKKVAGYILVDYYASNQQFRKDVAANYPQGIEEIREKSMAVRDPFTVLWDDYRKIFDYFDDWVVVEVDEDEQSITGFKIRKNQKDEKKRIETINW